ncbi:translation initiation factor IF-2 [bacterium]|nr:MAG: translation initiation factor IF-2 [bacterium]
MAEKNRVYEIAKVHDLASKELLSVLEELGVMAKSHMSVITDEDLELVEKHFSSAEAKGEKVVERSQRIEVEKARPKPKRMSAREKLEARRLEKEEAARVRAEQGITDEPADAASVESTGQEAAGLPAPEKPLPRLHKVKAFKPEPVIPVAGLKPAAGAPSSDEPKAAASDAGNASAASAANETKVAPVAPRVIKPAQRVDLKAIARAAAKTRERIADDMKTRMAAPEPKRPVRGASKPAAPARGGGSSGTGASQPRPIDPNAIRTSVRKALGSLNVPRGGQRGDRGPQQQQRGQEKKRGGRKVREDRRDKVARHLAREEALQVRENELRITEFITLGELADKLEAKPQELIMKLMGMGVMATMNQRLERDQIELLVADYEDMEIHWLDTAAGEDIEVAEEDEAGEQSSRPPVVTVMGHVDHGKTTLLDYLRKTKVTEGEAGGITQHIGAYQVETPRGVISFLDTPGHEAFTAMRARGARVTDIVVVVVAADDKVMPQTVEAIDHAKASNCPIIIAINKIDLPAADPAGVKQALMQHSVLVEEFGGEVQAVEISAKQGTNVDALLEAISLQAELLELKAVAEGRARATVVEARKDLGRGPVFTALVTRGTLRVGDPYVVGPVDGRVRAMLDEFDNPIEAAGPSCPVVILGASDVPQAGDQMDVVESDSAAKDIARKRQAVQREQMLHAPKRKTSLEGLFERMQSQEEAVELNLLVKGDVSGSVEAVCDAMMSLSNEKVSVVVIHRGVGGINDNDIMLAAASDAIIIGFHLRPDPATRQLALAQHVDLKIYDIIYEAVDDVKAAMKGLLAPLEKEVAMGSVEVRELFRVPKIGVIAGCYVVDGEVKRNAKVRVIREQVPVYDGIVSSLRRFKEDASAVKQGFECGVGIEGFGDIKVGDILETYEIQKVEQEL